MNALDKLLTQGLAAIIKKKVGIKTYQKIEERLKERYKLTAEQALRDFQRFDATLREFFGPGADSIERDFLKHIISLDSKESKPWITIESNELARLILRSYGDIEKNLILDYALKKPDVILFILEKCEIPKSTGYRIVNELIEDGLLIESGSTVTREGKKASLYTPLFDNIKIDIIHGELSVRIQIREEVLQDSFLVKLLQEIQS